MIENQTFVHDQRLLNKLPPMTESLKSLDPRHFTDYLNPSVFHLVHYSDLNAGMEDLKNLKINGIVHIGDQFEEYYLQRVTTHWTEIEENIAKETSVTFYGDPTKEIVFRGLEAYLMDAYMKFWKASRVSLGMNNSSMFLIDYGDSIPGQRRGEISDKSYFTDIGQLLSYLNMIAMGISGFSMLNELKDETMKRCLSVGIKTRHLFLSQLMVNGLFLGISSIFGMLTTVYLLDLPINGSFVSASLLIIGQVLVSTVLGQIMAIFLFSEVTIMILTVSLGYFLNGPCGLLISLESQPYYMEMLRYLSPFTLPSIGVRNVLVKRSTLSDMIVLKGLILLVIDFILCTWISLLALSRRLYN